MAELSPKARNMLRLAVDYSGAATFVLAFFITMRLSPTHQGDFQIATGCLVGISALALLVGFVVERRVAPLPLIYGGAALVFGGLTLVFHDVRFVKMKTTFIDLALGSALLIGLAIGRSPIKLVMGDSLKLSEAGWGKLTVRFGVFFLCMAVLNEIVWRTQPDAVWVLFRMPGLLIISFLFAFTQMPMMMKDARETEAAAHLIDTQQ
jgi:intracellular septation protein